MKRTLWGLGVLLLLAPLTAVLLRFHRPLPQVNGTIEIDGAGAPIEILRDAHGIPHIRAATRADAIFGLGFVHAQDRLWQMDVQRRAAAGRLAEVLGPAAVETDRFMRTIGFARAARDARLSLERRATQDPETLPWLEAYVRGVNAFLARTSGWRLPIEYGLTGATPEPWTVDDVIGTMKLLAWAQGMNWREDLMRLRLTAKVGAARAEELLPSGFDGATILPAGAASVSPSDAQALAAVARLLEHIAPASAGASNAWVLGGTRTATGRPILANDPHIPSQAPATWYLAHITGGDLDVIGATFPGVCAVVIGHNGRVAWGVTNAMGDAQDLFVVRHDEPVETREEIIKVEGGDDVRLQVRTSANGPIISDLVDERGVLALRWTGLDADDATMTAFLRANLARDVEQLRSALSGIHAPVLSVVYAASDGTIGYTASGRVPVRDGATGAWIAHANTAASFILNPPSDRIVTANNAIGGAAPSISSSFDLSYRAERIAAMIDAESAITLDDTQRMQQDVVSLQVRALAPLLFDRAGPRDARAHAALRAMTAWDGAMRGGSAEAALFKRYYFEAARGLFRDDLGDALYADYESAGAGLARALHRLARTGGDAWCDDVELPGNQSCGATLGSALDRAIAALDEQQGSAMNAWRWDRDNDVRFPHAPMDAVPLLRPFFSRELPRPGDGFTVNPVMRIREAALIASYRQVIDVGDWEHSRFVIPLGQSGHPMSAHYDDMLPLWHEGHYVPMAFSDGAVRAAAWHTLTLRPRAPASSADIPREK